MKPLSKDDSRETALGQSPGVHHPADAFRDPALRQAVLMDVTRGIIAAGHDEAELARVIFEKLAPHVGANIVLNERLLPDSRELVRVAAFGVPDLTEISGVPDLFSQRVVETFLPVAIGASQIESDEKAALHRLLKLKCYSCQPLVSTDGRVLGTLALGSTHGEAFTTESVAFLHSVGNYVSLAWERIEADREIRDAEQRIRSLFDHNIDAIFSVDAECRIIDANRVAQRICGNTLPELRGADFSTFVTPETQALVERGLRDALAGKSQALEMGLIRKNRDIADLVVNVIPMKARGSVLGVYFIAEDVTARKKTEALLRESEAREAQRLRLSQAVLSSVPDFVYVFDREFRVTYANEALLLVWGRTWDETRGRRLAELGGGSEYAARIEGDLARVLARRRPVRGDVPYFGSQGLRIHEYIFVPVLDTNGTVEAIAGVTRDVTDRKRAEEAADAANKAKDEFLATLSHELRTPLNPVLLLACEGEENQNLPESVRADYAMIRRNVELEARLIDDLLDITRIERGKMRMEFRPVDAHELIERTLEILKLEIAPKALSIVTELNASLHEVTGDSVRLKQSFWNVIKNAVKYSPTEGVITIRTSVTGADSLPRCERSLIVEVQDTGEGIAPEDLSLIFQAFEQGKHTVRSGGLGLGLAITRRIVGLHGGSIHAASPGIGLGATFTIELPLAPKAPPPPGSPMVSEDAPDTLRILLLEDHDSTRAALERLLVRRGHSVHSARSIADARTLTRDHTFDLLLADIGLPDGDGCDFMREMVRVGGPPGIALSGYGMEADVRRCLAAGFITHLTKPINLRALDRVLGSIPR